MVNGREGRKAEETEGRGKNRGGKLSFEDVATKKVWTTRADKKGNEKKEIC